MPRLDPPTEDVQGCSAADQPVRSRPGEGLSIDPFRPARLIVARPRPAVSTSGLPVIRAKLRWAVPEVSGHAQVREISS